MFAAKVKQTKFLFQYTLNEHNMNGIKKATLLNKTFEF